MGKTLHQWDSQVTYETLTLEEIQRSVERANATNGIQEHHDAVKDDIDNLAVKQLKRHQEGKKAIPNTVATGEVGPTKPPKAMKQSYQSDQ